MPTWAIVLISISAIVLCAAAIVEFLPHHRFIDAAGEEDLTRLRRWLDAGHDPNRPGLFGLTALGVAVSENRLTNVDLLLERGADPNQPSLRVLPLQSAVGEDHDEIAERLVAAGADFNRPGLMRTTPLQDAAVSGKIDCLRLFHDHGADFNVRTSHGNPLIVDVLLAVVGSREAEREPLRQAVAFLLDHGASPNVRSSSDVPAIAVALEDPPTLRLMVDGGAMTDVSFLGADLAPVIHETLKKLT